MRMWMIPAHLLCAKHLMGEHFEIHKHRHNFVKQHSISGRIKPVTMIEPARMQTRHDELAEEILRRGMHHASPYTLPDLSYLPTEERNAKVSHTESYTELCKRCLECQKRIHPYLQMNISTKVVKQQIPPLNDENMVYIRQVSIKQILKP